ncbi:MAG: FHA domain-containing protein [Clostridiales Family XIII bacterium]|nr:FHA domain-containing protein [Clostridiales Family XIII bacterium]
MAALAAFALCLPMAAGATGAGATAADGPAIEQIHVDGPNEIRAYIRADGPISPDSFTAAMGDGRLASDVVAMDVEALADPGACMYIFLVDVSKSVSQEQMDTARRAIGEFYEGSVRQGLDRFALIPFGDIVYYGAEYGRRGFLAGGEDPDEAMAAIGRLDRSDSQTAFYSAVSRAVELASGGGGLPERKAIIVLSDGDEDPRYKENDNWPYEDIEAKLKIGSEAGGVPVYSIGLSPRFDIGADWDNFQRMSKASGGRFWEVPLGADIGEAFDALKASVLGVSVLRLTAPDLGADAAGYSLSIKRDGADVLPAPLPIEPSEEDGADPEVGSVEQLEGREGIRVRFSERLDPSLAGDMANYLVNDAGGASVAVKGVQYAVEDGAGCSELIFEDRPYSGAYTLSLLGLADYAGRSVSDVPVPFEYEGEAVAMKYLRDYWWAVLIVAIAAIALIALRVSYSVLRKRKGLVKIEGKVGFGDAVEFRHEFETPETKRLCLIVTDTRGDAQKVELDVNKSAFVGRSKTNNLSFDDDSMSRQHFVIEADGDAFFVTDLQTTNGTFLNGVRLSGKRRLEHNDVITAGREKFVFKAT